MSQCIQCKSIISGMPHHEHIDTVTGEKWQWCSMSCLMNDDLMTDCQTCGLPVVIEDAMQRNLYLNDLSADTVHFCSPACYDKAE